jgi:hypothetical protein
VATGIGVKVETAVGNTLTVGGGRLGVVAVATAVPVITAPALAGLLFS